MRRIALPFSIVLASLIIGGFFYAIQINKQESIERQQRFDQENKRIQAEIDNKMAEIKMKQDECNALSSGVKQRWNNAIGVTYDEKIWEDCVVTFTDPKSGEIQKSPLKFMQDTK